MNKVKKQIIDLKEQKEEKLIPTITNLRERIRKMQGGLIKSIENPKAFKNIDQTTKNAYDGKISGIEREFEETLVQLSEIEQKLDEMNNRITLLEAELKISQNSVLIASKLEDANAFSARISGDKGTINENTQLTSTALNEVDTLIAETLKLLNTINDEKLKSDTLKNLKNASKKAAFIRVEYGIENE